MSQRKPTGAVGSPMDDSLATVRVVVTDTRAARIPHTGRRLVSSQSDAFVPTQRRPGSQARNGTYSLRACARSAVPRRRTAPIVCALARGLRCRDEERHLYGTLRVLPAHQPRKKNARRQEPYDARADGQELRSALKIVVGQDGPRHAQNDQGHAAHGEDAHELVELHAAGCTHSGWLSITYRMLRQVAAD